MEAAADWHRRVVDRSLRDATQRSIDRGSALVTAAAALLERADGGAFTVQDVADEAGQSLRTLYQYFESKDDLLLAVFEEAMRAYATLIRAAVEPLDDAMERLAGALVAAARLPELTGGGVNAGLARLRLRLTEAEPELIGRSQEPVTSLLGELIGAALPDVDRDPATFLVLGITTAAITSDTIGNDLGVARPSTPDLVAFCLRGLGADVDRAWIDAVAERIRLPKGELRLR